MDGIAGSGSPETAEADASERRFRLGLALITGVGFAIRVGDVWHYRRNRLFGGDAFYYHAGANLLVHGKGFIEPILYAVGLRAQSADHPPLYLLFLAVPSAIGLDTPLAHMLWSTLLGTGTIVVVGFLGRRVAGLRCGLLAAAFVAVYPNVWQYDGSLM